MRHGGDIYGKNSGRIDLDFSVSLNPLGIPDGLRTAYLQAASDLEHYPDPECRQLREAIAENEDGAVQKEQVVCGNGASELFLAAGLALQKLCRGRGDRNASVIIPVPTYSGYEYAMRAAGVHSDFYQMHGDEGFRLTSEFLQMLEERVPGGRALPDAIFLCTPNNPTGSCIEPELLTELNDFSRRNRVFLFVDECYMTLSGHGAASGKTDSGRKGGNGVCSYSARPYLSGNPRLVVFDAFTKTYAAPGLRLGYAICGDPSFAELLAQCRSEWSVSIPAQAAGIAALRERWYLQETAEVISEERRYCTRTLEELGMTVFPGDANFLLFVSDSELQRPLLDRGILIRDCGGLRGIRSGDRSVRNHAGPERHEGNYYYRIGVRRHADNVRLMQTLEETLTKSN